MILWVTTSGCWEVEDNVSPESNLAVPVKLLELEDGRRCSTALSTASAYLAWLNIASMSFALNGSWASIPLYTERISKI